LSYLDEETKEGIKILFTGLDGAGKSSIILSLLRKISKIAIVRPTKGASRRIYEFLGMHVSEWDLGGQIGYRKTYFKDCDLYFSRTSIMIYVIDIQNPDRILESLEYLSDIVENFKKLQIEPLICIFFHKTDPDIYERAQEELTRITNNIQKKIKAKIQYRNLTFFRTTIFDLSTIMTVMSDILIKSSPKTELIRGTVEEFAKKINAEGLEIIDDNSFIIGSYYENEAVKTILNATSPYFLKVQDTFEKVRIGECQPEDQMVVQRFGKFFFFKKFLLKGAPFYLLVCKEDIDFSEDDYLFFIDLLKEIISK